MNGRELLEQALSAFPDQEARITRYMSLLEWVDHYGRLMEHPDSPWVCSGYNNAVANLEKFRKKNPDIAEWFESHKG